jgi:hypothetical protein
MAVDDAQRREYLQKNVTADLQYIWDDSEVSLDLQHRLGQHYKNLRVFVALAESSTELREALKTDYQLDAAQGAGQRAEVARVISAWTAGRQLYEKENELQAESKVMGLPRSLQHSERLAMLRAVETTLGTLSEHDVPSSEYLALKVEECENGEVTAASLDEITSKAHKNTASLQTSLDTSGHVRVVKTKTKGSLPSNTEEYRQAMKLEAVTWLCMASKFKAKHWLAGLKMDHFLKFVDYILGDRVNAIKVPVDNGQQAVKPNWALVLQYEHRLRREAFKLVNRGESTLGEALISVTKDPDLKEAYFTTPLARLLLNRPQSFRKLPTRKGTTSGIQNPKESGKGSSRRTKALERAPKAVAARENTEI